MGFAWLTTALRSSWFRYATVAVVGGVIVFGAGYLKGYGKASAAARAEIADALLKQQERLLSQADKDRRLAIAQLKREQKTRTEFREIPVPISADCSSAEWLQSYNDAIRLANSAGAKTAAGANAGSDRAE